VEFAFVAAIFGILIGSFLNVIILRLPKGEDIVFEPSHCPTCKTKLKPWHNIPLLSYIFLKGKCAFCQEKISWQYPLVEILNGVVFFFIALKYGSFSLALIFILLSFSMLLALTFIDLKYQMVPDSLNLLAIVFAIFGAWNFNGIIQNFQNALLFAGGFTLLRFTLSYFLTSSYHRAMKKTQTSWNKHYDRTPFVEAMGEGDIMVAATMGALLGIPLTLVAIFLSAVLALPIMLFMQQQTNKEVRVAYVPFLTIATFIVMLFDAPIMHYINNTHY